MLPAVLVVLLILIWLSSLAVPESAAGHLPLDQEPIRTVLKRPFVLSLFAVCFLIQLSHGPYYAFFSIYLEGYGYSTATIGWLWALGVVAEIGVFLLMPRLLPRYGARNLLLTAVWLTALRWLLIGGLADHPAVIICAQALHAASFGLYHAVAIYLVHTLFVGVHQGRGQALYSSLSFGAGGAVGKPGKRLSLDGNRTAIDVPAGGGGQSLRIADYRPWNEGISCLSAGYGWFHAVLPL